MYLYFSILFLNHMNNHRSSYITYCFIWIWLKLFPVDYCQINFSKPYFSPPEKHFLDEHRTTLVERVNNVNSILDRLLDKHILNSVSYSDIYTLPNDPSKMRALYNGPLKSCGNRGKDELFSILQDLQPYLMDDLMKKKGDI